MAKTINVGTLENQETVLSYLKLIYASSFSVDKIDWTALFNSRRTGEVFATKFYSLSVSDTYIGERMLDSIGKTCAPSTATVKGQDDFASYNAFWYVDCNYIVNDDGSKTITAIDGQSTFSRTGKVDVGVLTPPLYYGINEVTDGKILYLSDTPNDDLGLVLMPHCRDNAGNEMGFGLVTKYDAGFIDDVMYSSSGLAPGVFTTSYNTLHDYMAAKGVGYVGAGSELLAYLRTMLQIKYAVSSSRAYFLGVADHDNYTKAAAEDTDVNYIRIKTTDTSLFYVGDCVCLGVQSGVVLDRSDSEMYSIVKLAQISAIEQDTTDTTLSRVYLDVDTTFSTTTDTYILEYPLYSGQTDTVLGNDGYLENDNMHSYKIQGVEIGTGACLVSGNELAYMNPETGAFSISIYNRNWGNFTNDAETMMSSWKKIGEFDLSAYSSSTSKWIGEVDVDLETGSEIISSIGSGSSSGTGDELYFSSSNKGLRRVARYGSVDAAGGLSCINVSSPVSYSSAFSVGRVA